MPLSPAMLHYAFYLLFFVSIGAISNNANTAGRTNLVSKGSGRLQGPVQPLRSPVNQQAAKPRRQPTTPRSALSLYRPRWIPVKARQMKNLLIKAGSEGNSPNTNSQYGDWKPVLTLRKSYYSNLDVITYRPSSVVNVICVNPATNEAFALFDATGRSFLAVNGTYFTYSLSGMYAGVTFSTLKISTAQYNGMNSRCATATSSWKPQPGPLEWRWRFELEGTAEQAEVAPGNTLLTITQRSAQILADRWPDCCRELPPSPSQNVKLGRRRQARKAPVQSNKGSRKARDQAPASDVPRGNDETWLVKVRIVKQWNIDESNITQMTVDKSCIPVKCVAFDGREEQLFIDGQVPCAKGNWTGFTIKNWYGLQLSTRGIEATPYRLDLEKCVEMRKGYIYVQPHKPEDPNFYYRFEIWVGTGSSGSRTVAPGYTNMWVTKEMAQRYVDNMTTPNQFGRNMYNAPKRYGKGN